MSGPGSLPPCRPPDLPSRPPRRSARPPARAHTHTHTLNWTCGSPWAAIAAILRERAAAARAPHKGRGREERAGRRGRGVRRWGKGSWRRRPGRCPFAPLSTAAPRPPEEGPHHAAARARPSPPGHPATFQKSLRACPTEAGKMAEARFKCRRRSGRRRAEGEEPGRGGATAPRPTTRRTRTRTSAQPVRLLWSV